MKSIELNRKGILIKKKFLKQYIDIMIKEY